MASSVDINTHRHQLRPGCSRIKTQSLGRAQTEPSPAGHSRQPVPHHSHLTGSASPPPTGLSTSLSLPPPLPTLGTMVLYCLTPEAPGRMLVDYGPSDPKVSGAASVSITDSCPGGASGFCVFVSPADPTYLLLLNKNHGK